MVGLVSTVIPVFNRPAMLVEAVDSVMAQSWRPIEIVLVNDGSTDETASIIDTLRATCPEEVKVIHKANGGPAMARQAGLEMSTGEFVQFLDSDDLLLPDKFALQIAGLRDDKDAGISYGKTYVSEHGVRAEHPAQRTGERHRTLFPALLQEPLWPTLTPLYRRSIVDAIGPWPDKRQLEDWEYDAQAGALGVKLHYCDAYIAETRNHEDARLCHLWKTDRAAMRDRILAYTSVHAHALRAGVERRSDEMQQFARSLLWMARLAGQNGFAKEAAELFAVSRATATEPGFEYRVYDLLARAVGWAAIGRLAAQVDSWRKL